MFLSNWQLEEIRWEIYALCRQFSVELLYSRQISHTVEPGTSISILLKEFAIGVLVEEVPDLQKLEINPSWHISAKIFLVAEELDERLNSFHTHLASGLLVLASTHPWFLAGHEGIDHDVSSATDHTLFFRCVSQKLRVVSSSKVLMNGRSFRNCVITIFPVWHIREGHTETISFLFHPSFFIISLKGVVNVRVCELPSNSGNTSSHATPVGKNGQVSLIDHLVISLFIVIITNPITP